MSVTGTVRALFSKSDECICCEGPHRFSTTLDLDCRVSKHDYLNDIDHFVHKQLHSLPTGTRVRITVEEVP